MTGIFCAHINFGMIASPHLVILIHAFGYFFPLIIFKTLLKILSAENIIHREQPEKFAADLVAFVKRNPQT